MRKKNQDSWKTMIFHFQLDSLQHFLEIVMKRIYIHVLENNYIFWPNVNIRTLENIHPLSVAHYLISMGSTCSLCSVLMMLFSWSMLNSTISVLNLASSSKFSKFSLEKKNPNSTKLQLILNISILAINVNIL